MRIFDRCALTITLVAMSLAVAGCNRSEPQSSSTSAGPTDGHVTSHSGGLPPGHPPIDMSAQSLPPDSLADAASPQWTVPQEWQLGKPSMARRGSFAVSGPEGQTADIAVTVFPGDVGGMLSNINRWRGQIGLGPVMPDEVAAMTTAIEVDGLKATVVDITADAPQQATGHPMRMIVVTVPHQGNSWFYKMTGDAPLLEAQKTTFLEFVQSTKF